MAKTRRVSPADFPRLTRFYGIGPTELAETPNNILAKYADAIPLLLAEETQTAILVSDMPHADKKDRARVFTHLSHATGSSEDVEKLDVRTEGGAAAAASLGISVEVPRRDDAVESE